MKQAQSAKFEDDPPLVYESTGHGPLSRSEHASSLEAGEPLVIDGVGLEEIDLDNWVEPEYESPAEVEKMEAASATGNLAAVLAIFQSEWLQVSPTERVAIALFSSAFEPAMKNDLVSVAQFLITVGVPFNEYHIRMAVALKSYSFLQLFLDSGLDINKPLGWGDPPPLAIACEDENLTRWFLNRGADPNAECELDLTPLSIAVYRAPFPIIKLLFDHGGSIEHGQLLHYAIRRNEPDQLEVLQFILDKGPPINHVMYQTRLNNYYHLRAVGIGTPLHEAADKGKLDMVKILLARGADPLIKDARGMLAVERAEYDGHDAVIEYLRPLSAPTSEIRHDFTDGRQVGQD